MLYFAHSQNIAGQRRLLSDHLRNVAQLAAQFGQSLEASHLVAFVALLHDIGKYNPEFQRYLLDAESSPSGLRRGPDHKGAGAILLEDVGLGTLAFLIQGHHGGLRSQAKLKDWLRERRNDPEVQKALHLARHELPELQTLVAPPLPTFIRTPLQGELFLRMLFSSLVDADFLDTERHFSTGKSHLRRSHQDITILLDRFQKAHQQRFRGASLTAVNTIRAAAYTACIQAAERSPGIYRLTLPTGGAKTLSSLAYGLHHAQKYEKKRIIYAIPYMSITEQTAQEFRRFFPEEGIVLEHHSGVAFQEDSETLTRRDLWRRLAAENWDAPLVVTTTVQLFESLFACSTSTCRKLHNIAQSVIILDEVQMLPTHLLTPMLDVLRQLVVHYGVTAVLCTATQPALHQRAGFEGLDGIEEIIPDAQEHFAALKRVQYQFLPEPLTWVEVAEAICKEHQVLTIVNTKADALALLKALDLPDDASVFHLSTYMCGAHRRTVLEAIRRKLKNGEACRVVSTQLIEAGVDVDFPSVWRAIGPLDRIAQAAGRCNREGKLSTPGRVVVFEPAEGSLPPGSYRIGTQFTRTLLQEPDVDLYDPAIFQSYFERYFQYVNRDEPGIQVARQAFDYETVASLFKMIEDETETVIVPYQDSDDPERVVHLLAALQNDPTQAYTVLRQLQPYMVNLRERECAGAFRRGLVKELLPRQVSPDSKTKRGGPEIWQWLGSYDPVRGVVLDGYADPENFIQ